MPPDIHLLNIPFDPIDQRTTINIITERLQSGEVTRIVTINPEFILEAEKNPQFKKTLQSADLHLADGIGILWATHYLQMKPLFPRVYKKYPRAYALWQCIYTLLLIPFTSRVTKNPLPERVTGSDLFLPLIDLLAKTQQKIFLLGGAPGVGEKTAKVLKERIPQAEIVGYYAGSPNQEDAQKIIAIINDSKATALFVAFQFPAQDIWIANQLGRLPLIKVAMGVGGTFDFIAGTGHIDHANAKAKRAPQWMRRMHLEWLWRLVTQPYRWRRIGRATWGFVKRTWEEKVFFIEK